MAKRNSRGGDWAALFVVALCFAYVDEVLVAGVITGIVWMLLKYLEKRESSKALRAVNEAAISMEADHRALFTTVADPYGEYPPVTMPLTYPICDTFPYRDYDDGLREWR